MGLNGARAMDNPILDEIMTTIVSRLKVEYGFCGLLDSPEFALINSSDGNKDIKITIKVEDGELHSMASRKKCLIQMGKEAAWKNNDENLEKGGVGT